MTKYSPEFKIQLVMEYITKSSSSYTLGRKYHVSANLIRKWVQQYQLRGIESFRQRHHKRFFSAEFKWNVIDYYQTHAESYAQVAAKFDLLPSQISIWRQAFIKYGYDALKPHQKGRLSKVKKQTKKQKQKLVEKKEIDQLREELARTKQELYDTKMDRDILKKIIGPVRTLKARKKTQIVDQIRADQAELPKPQRYKIGDLLSWIGLAKATYHDERKRIANQNDKYREVKKEIQRICEQGKVRGRLTYGYRRVQTRLDQLGVHLAGATVRHLMSELGVQVEIYNRHRNGKYSSYHGHVGKLADNVLKQQFNAQQPYHVIHTDVTQVRLANQQWAYISAMTDEASKEVLAFQMSSHPNRELIMNTLNELLDHLPDDVRPIIHSDQGWHYQLNYYTQKLKDYHFIQSMSRKGNCHDNAPIESFFHLYKTELLQGLPPCSNITELRKLSLTYIEHFNNERISLKTKGMTPVEYRNHALAS